MYVQEPIRRGIRQWVGVYGCPRQVRVWLLRQPGKWHRRAVPRRDWAGGLLSAHDRQLHRPHGDLRHWRLPARALLRRRAGFARRLHDCQAVRTTSGASAPPTTRRSIAMNANEIESIRAARTKLQADIDSGKVKPNLMYDMRG